MQCWNEKGSSAVKNDKTERFETMPVGRALLTMAISTIVSQLITMIYNLTDRFFMGFVYFSHSER